MVPTRDGVGGDIRAVRGFQNASIRVHNPQHDTVCPSKPSLDGIITSAFGGIDIKVRVLVQNLEEKRRRSAFQDHTRHEAAGCG